MLASLSHGNLRTRKPLLSCLSSPRKLSVQQQLALGTGAMGCTVCKAAATGLLQQMQGMPGKGTCASATQHVQLSQRHSKRFQGLILGSPFLTAWLYSFQKLPWHNSFQHEGSCHSGQELQLLLKLKPNILHAGACSLKKRNQKLQLSLGQTSPLSPVQTHRQTASSWRVWHRFVAS